MDKINIKEALSRFRQWQEQPFEYKLASSEVQHCKNCGNDYTGNFCPICSQKAGMGRVGWRSVHQGIMDIWGLGTRSLLYSVWQLLWRPGNIIAEYIDGKRQVSFPPVKMLFILAVVYSMVVYWFFPVVLGISIVDLGTDDEKVNMILGDFSTWMKKNYSWSSLFMAMLAVIPTWVMFRYSPRHTAHTLPEGFFIQVFLANLMVAVGFLIFPVGMIDPWYYTVISSLIFAFYYIIAYKYLFGYGFWGTFWRCGFVYLTVVFSLSVILFLAFKMDLDGVVGANGQLSESHVALIKMAYSVGSAMVAVSVLVVGHVINLIATRKFRRELKQNTMQPR